MKEIFSLSQTDRPVREMYKLNVDIPCCNQVPFDRKALTLIGPKTWNNLPYHIKSAENLTSVKTMIKFWNGQTYSCKSYCKKKKFILFFDKDSWKFLLRNSGLSNDSRFC